MQQNLQQELELARKRTAKPMLWISMVSMVMIFAGLLSAYVISSKRVDWVSFDLPFDFTLSTIVLLCSSATLFAAKIYIKRGKRFYATVSLWKTLIFGLLFVFLQYKAFMNLQEIGLFFTGPKSEVSSSMLMVIVFTHFLHLFAGVIVLFVVIYNHYRFRYTADSHLGLTLAGIFWHFLDFLWLALYLFFVFIT